MMQLSAFKPEDTFKNCSRKEKLLRLTCPLSAISSLCFPRQALEFIDAACSDSRETPSTTVPEIQDWEGRVGWEGHTPHRQEFH